MKKIGCMLFLLLTLSSSGFSMPLEKEVPITLTAPCFILMEAETGAVIFEKNADEKRPAASIAKLMTILLTLEKVEQKVLDIHAPVRISRHAAGQIGSEALLDEKSTYTLNDLLKATIVASGNDSAVALAEKVSGTEEAFVKEMNRRAKALQMTNTVYQNATGLPQKNQFTSARDIARISREILKHPLYFEYAKTYLYTLTHPSKRETHLTNTNRLVRFYTGCDGLKTGSTNEAKYCITATAKRDDMRFIAVLLGANTSTLRFKEAQNMLDYAFSNYKTHRVLNKNMPLNESVSVTYGAQKKVKVAPKNDVFLLLKNGEIQDIRIECALKENVQAPIEKGEELGELYLYKKDKRIAKTKAVAWENVPLYGFLHHLLLLVRAF